MFTFNGFLAKLKTKFSTNKTPTNNHRFPLVLSDGTPDGNATPADIMQFLGAFVTLAASESSTPDTFEGIAGLRKNILMAVPTAVINTGKFQDMPERGFGFFINLFIGGSSVQFYVRDSSLNIYCRDINGGSGIISSWFKLTNTPV